MRKEGPINGYGRQKKAVKLNLPPVLYHFSIISFIRRNSNIFSILPCPKFIFPLRNRDMELSDRPICSARSLLFTLWSFIASLIISLIIFFIILYLATNSDDASKASESCFKLQSSWTSMVSLGNLLRMRSNLSFHHPP